jgi:hypothetical protein
MLQNPTQLRSGTAGGVDWGMGGKDGVAADFIRQAFYQRE